MVLFSTQASFRDNVSLAMTLQQKPSNWPKVALMFSIFGPYIVARLNALAKVTEVLGVEGSISNDTYNWNEVRGKDGFCRVTLFTDAPIARKSSVAILRRIWSVLDENRPDVVAIPGWSSRWSFSMQSWAIKNKVPMIVMSESTAFDFNRIWWREWLKRRVVKTFAAAHVGGRHHVDYLVRLGLPRERIFTGYDAVDNEYFGHGSARARAQANAMRTTLGLPERYFLASARFVEKKNLLGLIEAYSCYRAHAGTNPWSLVLLGDGELRPQVEAKIAKNGLTHCVVLPDFKQYEELPAYYGLADAFVHASTVEQWGLVVNEAMASGLPLIISNRCGCALELVREGENGFTFDPCDTAALAVHMTRVASDNCERSGMGQRSREIVARWGPNAFAEGMSNAIDAAFAAPILTGAGLDRTLIGALKHWCWG
jgi:1,2-diacylglycerol 3-alpha-glucosyltransferase